MTNVLNRRSPGINEDPVTGRVQTFLKKYWNEKLHNKMLKVFQLSARTGFMMNELQADNVLIYGDAVLVFEEEFNSIEIKRKTLR